MGRGGEGREVEKKKWPTNFFVALILGFACKRVIMITVITQTIR